MRAPRPLSLDLLRFGRALLTHIAYAERAVVPVPPLGGGKVWGQRVVDVCTRGRATSGDEVGDDAAVLRALPALLEVVDLGPHCLRDGGGDSGV